MKSQETNSPSPGRMGRRAFLKRAALLGGALGLAAAGVGGKMVWDNRQRAAILAERERRRPTGAIAWLTHDEYVLLGALAAHLAPSDNAGPGAPEAQAVDVLDRLIATSAHRRALYAPGLLAFDELALAGQGAVFVELAPETQLALLKVVDQMQQEINRATASLPERVQRKAHDLVYDGEGIGPALDLFPQLVADVMQAFYSSQAAWNWLGYDGPPQPTGYVGRLGSCTS